MRGIKFRAWDTETKEMSHDFLSKNWLRVCIESPYVELMQFTGLHDKNAKEIYEGDIVQFKSNGTRGRHWSWRKDETGKEVLGGDIVYEGYTDRKTVSFYNGCYNLGGWHLHKFAIREDVICELHETIEGYTSKTTTHYDGFEVIGNVYENPELLKVNDNAPTP